MEAIYKKGERVQAALAWGGVLAVYATTLGVWAGIKSLNVDSQSQVNKQEMVVNTDKQAVQATRTQDGKEYHVDMSRLSVADKELTVIEANASQNFGDIVGGAAGEALELDLGLVVFGLFMGNLYSEE